MPQLLQPPCVLEGQLLGVPACQQEYDGLLFVSPYLPCVVLQTGAHSAGALALASRQTRSTNSDARRGILRCKTARQGRRDQSRLAWKSTVTPLSCLPPNENRARRV
eukprot:scaffold22175_cov72-Phaeocystis_antarctica.AAC.1